MVATEGAPPGKPPVEGNPPADGNPPGRAVLGPGNPCDGLS